MSAAEIVLDLDEIARIFQVTEKAVRGWIAAGMPVRKRGTQGGARKKTRIALRAAVEWYFDQNYERLELDRQRTRHSAEQADKLALENAERRGELGEWSVWQRELEKFLGEMRTSLLALPTKAAPRLDGSVNQRKDRLEQMVHELLAAFGSYRFEEDAKTRKRAAGGIVHRAAATAKANGKRVGRRKAETVERE